MLVGAKRFLSHLNMLESRHILEHSKKTIYIEKSSWIRAKYSGLLHDHHTIGTFVKKEPTY
jgi:hypothetical protein